jgi:NTE family protein
MKRRVALALGSGGARGLAHIGVIDALIEAGWQIEAIAGASMGALVGGFQAAGKLGVYRDWVRTLNRQQVARLLDPGWGEGGLIKGRRLITKLHQLVGDAPIESLAVPFTAVATDLDSGAEVWLRDGSLFEAIRASMAAPMVFTPHRHRGRLLSDGGLVNPLPVSALPVEPDLLRIAVDLSGPSLPGPPRKGTPGLLDVALQSMQVVQDTVTRLRLAECSPDVTVAIPRNACGFHEFWRADKMMALGRQRLAEALAQQRQLLPALGFSGTDRAPLASSTPSTAAATASRSHAVSASPSHHQPPSAETTGASAPNAAA